MSFVQKETEYGEKHRRSDYRLRKAPKEEVKQEQSHRKYPMEGYEASEEELRHKQEPTQQVLLKGGGRRFSAGYNRDQKLTMAFSKDQGEGRTREEEIFRAEESVVDGISPEYMRTGPQTSEKRARVLEDRKEKQKNYLLQQITQAADISEKSLLTDEFSFLSTAKEKAQIRLLEEEARAHSTEHVRAEAQRQQAAVLRRDVLYKEEEQRSLLETLTAQVDPEQEKSKRSQWMPIRSTAATPQAEETEGNPQGEDAQGEDSQGEIPPEK